MYSDNNRNRRRRELFEPIKRKKSRLNVILPFISMVLCMVILSYTAFFKDGKNKDTMDAAHTDTKQQENIVKTSEELSNTEETEITKNTEELSEKDMTETTKNAEGLSEKDKAEDIESGNDQSEVYESEGSDNTDTETIINDIPVQAASYTDLKAYCDTLMAGRTVALKTDTCMTDEGQIAGITVEDINSCFYAADISEKVFSRIEGKSYKEDCTIDLSELRYVRVLHYGFDGDIHIGEMIVNEQISEDIVEIFAELYAQKYPIERMLLIDEYNAEDEISMMANNTSSFNYRVISGSSKISKHGYGMAIDINPLYNPYVYEKSGQMCVEPATASEYADRTVDCEYYIRENDVCYNAFISRGFTWGGNWNTKKDYQHFER